MRYSYAVGGLIVGSNVPLQGLAPVDRQPQCRLVVDDAAPPRTRPPSWMRRWTSSGRLDLSCARESTGFLLRFHRVADVRVSGAGDEFRCHFRRRVPAAALARLFIDQALPLGLAAAGRHVLHASAVMTGAGAVAFMGPSGAGKSTMAASLVTGGCGLLADDWLLVGYAHGETIAEAGSPVLKLHSDSARGVLGLQGRGFRRAAPDGDKARVDPPRSGWSLLTGAPRLYRGYFLEPDPAPDAQVQVRPLSAREAFVALVSHSLTLDPADPGRLRSEAARCERLARAPIWFGLRVPRRLDSLRGTHHLLVAAA